MGTAFRAARGAGRLAVLAVLCMPASLRAQTIVPVEQEPAHTVKFENAVVRVIDAALPVGHATLNHTHSRDNVPVAVAGGRVATTLIGGAPVESAVKVGQVSFAVGGYTHVVANVGTTPLHFIDSNRPPLLRRSIRRLDDPVSRKAIREAGERHLLAAIDRVEERLELRLVRVVGHVAAVEHLHRQLAPGVTIQAGQLL